MDGPGVKIGQRSDHSDCDAARFGEAVKRIFSEQLRAKSEIGLGQEAKTKFWAYKIIKNYGEA